MSNSSFRWLFSYANSHGLKGYLPTSLTLRNLFVSFLARNKCCVANVTVNGFDLQPLEQLDALLLHHELDELVVWKCLLAT